MSFQAPISISDALDRIAARRLLLPAIQREFVWQAWQIEWLFDSLLQGYPVGSFLFWEVRDTKSKSDFQFYEFLRNYRERFATHNPEAPSHTNVDFDAVLDGQQRLTAVYVGLMGSYAYKMPRVWWEDSERVLPTRYLCLNVSTPAKDLDDEQSGRKYEFRFLTTDEQAASPTTWFRAGDILKAPSAYDFNKLLKDRGYLDNEFAAMSLSALHSVVHLTRTINYYSVQQADMEQALNVFVRVNSGGTKLSLSDMLLSTAIASWKRNARKEITGLVDRVQELGFFIDKDLVMKACLYLYSADIRYKVSNFTAAQVKPFEDNWDAIDLSTITVFKLIREFGFNDKSLTSYNALLPLIYWIHHKGVAAEILSKIALRDTRELMRKWLHTVLLKGIFGGSADTVLAAIRRAFTGEGFGSPFIRPGLEEFPSVAIGTILQAQGKDPNITSEFLDSLLDTRYEERQAFSILALLSPYLDYKNGDFHKDHLHPKSAFRVRELRRRGIAEGDMDFYKAEGNWNSILNLRHLDGAENKSKLDSELGVWAFEEANRLNCTTEKFAIERDLPSNPGSLDFSNFRQFIEFRRVTLRERLRKALS